MPRKPGSRTGRVVAVAVAIVVLAGAAIVFVAVVHKNGGSDTGGTSPSPSGTVETRAIPGLATDDLGISTGVQLFNEQGAKVDADVAGIAATGAHWIRTAVRWDKIEPDSASADDWTKTDRIVADARRHGVSLIFNVTGTPRWARAAGAGTVEFPPDLTTYATFTGKLAAQYRGKVAAYELGNEPNHTKTFARPDPSLYVQVLKDSYPLIKAADPDALVLTGGLGGVTKNGVVAGDVYLADLYRDGAKPYFDGVSYHPYSYPLLPSEDNGTRSWSHMLKARQVMEANGDGKKKIWVTEYGAPTDGPNSVSQERQAAIMYDAYRLWAGYPWAGPLCWFDYRDKGTDVSNHGDFFGLYTNDGQPKVALTQYQSLVRSVR